MDHLRSSSAFHQVFVWEGESCEGGLLTPTRTCSQVIRPLSKRFVAGSVERSLYQVKHVAVFEMVLDPVNMWSEGRVLPQPTVGRACPDD